MPSHVQNSNDFLNKIDTAKNIPFNCLLVTRNVRLFYTNIPNSEGIFAVKAAYESYTEKSVATKVIIKFLALIFTWKNFKFNFKNCLKKRGFTIGDSLRLHLRMFSEKLVLFLWLKTFQKEWKIPFISRWKPFSF